MTIREAEEALRSTGAHIVEGPDSVGIFGVVPGATKTTSQQPAQDLRVLAVRLMPIRVCVGLSQSREMTRRVLRKLHLLEAPDARGGARQPPEPVLPGRRCGNG